MSDSPAAIAARLGIGGNNPPSLEQELAERHAGLAKRLLELTEAVARFVEVCPTITTQQVNAAAAADLKMLRDLSARIEKARKDEKETFLRAGRVVDRWFGELRREADAAWERLNASSAAYLKQIEDEARRRAAEEAALAVEAACKAERAVLTGEGSFDEAIAAAERAEAAAAQQHASTADLTRMTGTYGVTATLQTSFDYEVTDPDKVPRQYCIWDPRLIRAAIKAGKREIDGVRIFPVHKTRVR